MRVELMEIFPAAPSACSCTNQGIFFDTTPFVLTKINIRNGRCCFFMENITRFCYSASIERARMHMTGAVVASRWTESRDLSCGDIRIHTITYSN